MRPRGQVKVGRPRERCWPAWSLELLGRIDITSAYYDQPDPVLTLLVAFASIDP